MTGTERILATLAGERPDRVPFAPNIWQWFYVNRAAGRLSAELAGAAEAMRRISEESSVSSLFD